MAGSEGAAARMLEFEETVANGPSAGRAGGLRLATRTRALQGPDKYKVLDHRRRQAQIRARRILAALETAE